MPYALIFVVLISFIASLIRSTFGFGESLVAVPLFLLFLPVEIAVPVSVMLSVVIALIVIVQDHQEIHFHSAKWLLIYAILGIPIGIVILVYTNELFVKIGLGTLIIIYSVYSLFIKRKQMPKQNKKLWLFICGFLSGVFGGAYGLNGPPLVVYGNMQQWSAKHFRATLQAYFLPASLLGLIAYYSEGLITAKVYEYFLVSLITAVPAIFIGRYLNKQLKNSYFFKYIYWGLILVGLILITSSLM